MIEKKYFLGLIALKQFQPFQTSIKWFSNIKNIIWGHYWSFPHKSIENKQFSLIATLKSMYSTFFTSFVALLSDAIPSARWFVSIQGEKALEE